MKQRLTFVLAAAALFAAVVVPSGQGNGNDRLNAATFEGLELRNIGPALVTGRIADFQVDPKNSSVYYVATAAGGVWKSVNRGITWTWWSDPSAAETQQSPRESRSPLGCP